MFKFSLFQIQYSGSALQKVAGTERIYSTSDPSGNTFDVVSISDLVESLEVEEGIYRIGNLSVTAKGLGATFFHNYNDDLNKPFVFLIRTDSDAVVFHGVIDPQSIKYNAGSQYTVFDVLDWNIFLRKRNVSARSVLEVKFSRPYDPSDAESLKLWLERYTGEDGEIDLATPDEFGNLPINPGDVIAFESEIGEHRAIIESIGTATDDEVPITATNIPNGLAGGPYDGTIRFLQELNGVSIYAVDIESASLYDALSQLPKGESSKELPLEVFIDQSGNNNPTDVRFYADRDRVLLAGEVAAYDGLYSGAWTLIYGPRGATGTERARYVRITFFAWPAGSKNAEPGGPPLKNFVLSDTGQAKVSIYQTTAIGEGSTAKILGRGIYGYYPASVFDRYKVENVIAALYNLSDFGVLKYVVNAVETPPGYNDTLSRTIELPDSPLSAVRLIQNTAYSFLRLVPTLDANGLPQVTVRILPRNRISPSDVGSVTAAVNVLRWTEGGAILPPTAVVVKPYREYGKPNTKKEYAGWYYAGVDTDENNDLTRKLRSVPNGPRVVEIEVNEQPVYNGKEWSGAGTVAVNDYRLKEIAKVYYNYYKDLARDAEFTLVDSRPDLLGKYVTINEVEGGRTVFVDRVGISFSTGQTTVTSRVGEYIAVSTATPTAVISGKSVFTDYNNDGLVDVDLSGLNSFDPLGRALSYQWKVNGANDQTGPIFRKTLPVGTHTIELTVTSPDGSHSVSRTIRVVEDSLGIPAAPDVAIANATILVRPDGKVLVDWSVNGNVTHLHYEYVKGETVAPGDVPEPDTDSPTMFGGGSTVGTSIVDTIDQTETIVIKLAPYNATYGVWGPTVLLTGKGAEIDISNFPDDSIPASAIIDGPGSGLDADYLDSYDSSAFTRKAENATITAEWTFTNTINAYAAPTVSNGIRAINFRHSYAIYADNVGAGMHNTRLWLDGPDGGEVVVGPRGGTSWLDQIRMRARRYDIEVNGGVFAVDGKIGSPGFVSGFTGAGWRIDPSINGGHAEFGSLVVRGAFRVYEFIINQIRSTNGSLFVSSAAKVEATGGGTFKMVDTSLPIPFVQGDLVEARRTSVGPSDSTNLYHIFGYVNVIDNVNKTFTVSLAEGSNPATAGETYELVRVGYNASRGGGIQRPERMGAIYLTSDDTYAPYIDIYDGLQWAAHINDKGGSGRLKARLGKLDGLSALVAGQPVSGYGIYTTNGFFEGIASITKGYFGPGGHVIIGDGLSAHNIAGKLLIGNWNTGSNIYPVIKLNGPTTSDHLIIQYDGNTNDWGIFGRVGGFTVFRFGNENFIAGINFQRNRMWIGAGTWGDANTPFFVNDSGSFSLGNAFKWHGINKTLDVDGNITARRLIAQLSDGSVMFDSDSRVTDAQNVGRHIGYHQGGKWLSPNNVTVATFYTYVLEGETRISCAFIGSMPTSAHPAAQGRVTLRVEPVRRTVAYDATAGTQFLTGATGTSSAFGNGMSSGSPWLMSGIARVDVSNYQKRLVKITVSVSYVGVSGYDISVRDIVVMAGRDIQGQLTEHAVWDGGALDSKLPRTL